jgi:hypothetical protein
VYIGKGQNRLVIKECPPIPESPEICKTQLAVTMGYKQVIRPVDFHLFMDNARPIINELY